jgi:hypothetical protein
MKKSMAFAVFMAATLVVTTAAFSEDSSKSQGDSSQEVVVKGQLKIKIETEKPDIDIKTDANEVASGIISTEESFLSISPEDVKDVKASLPDTMGEKRTEYHADLSGLESPPIFRISPKIPTGSGIDKWNFKVTDSTGGTVYLQKGDGNPPQEIKWDGLDKTGHMLKMGSPYWYVLTYIDKAGNPGSIRRETPKQVDAIKYRRDNKLYIEVSSGMMFDAKRKEKMTDAGKAILLEIQDYIKMSNKYPVNVQVYSEDQGISSDQIRTFQKMFETDLKIPKEFFKMDALIDNSLPKNYRVVFIING